MLKGTGIIFLTALSLAGCSASPGVSLPGTAAHAAVDEGASIPEPASVTSTGGILRLILTAAPTPITVAGRTFVSNVYNGAYIPPIIRVARGDEVRITYVNNVDKADIKIAGPQMSNVHYHGLAISPDEPADNPYISIPSSKSLGTYVLVAHASRDRSLMKRSSTYEYRWRVPSDHPQGLNWLHSHAHGETENQILSGMSGLLVVEGFFEQHYPELATTVRRTLLLKDIDLPGAKDDDPKTKTINGILGGTLRARPGQVEVWEIGNVGADAYFDLTIDGHRFWILGHDGNIVAKPEPVESVFLPPASRAVVAVKVGTAARYAIRSRAVDTGSAGDPNPSVQLATLVVAGTAVDDSKLVERLRLPAANQDAMPSASALRRAPVVRHRRVEFTETADGHTFFINGKTFDVRRIDFAATLGDVEQWTIVNDTDERHTLHIHQIDFLVTSVNGEDQDETGLRDNIDVPFRDPVTKKPGEVTIIVPFTNPEIVGKFPFHCHIAEHSDAGMMANMRVRAR
jgi:FtsP/CotA-like multicopper oxidase with cupredoxin domain